MCIFGVVALEVFGAVEPREVISHQSGQEWALLAVPEHFSLAKDAVALLAVGHKLCNRHRVGAVF